MSEQLEFGTDGIRGDADVVLGMAQRFGQAAGTYFRVFHGDQGDTMTLGWDPRESGEAIASAFAAGVMGAGLNVERCGIIPTPGVAHRARYKPDFVAGAVVSASHNPAGDNGIKLFDARGTKLPDVSQERIAAYLGGECPMPRPDRFGREIDSGTAAADAYRNFLVRSARGAGLLGGMRIALDTAHGAASHYAAGVFRSLGAHVHSLCDEPDGRNINEGCGAASDMTMLREVVVREQLDLGFAFDGDADRVMGVSPTGAVANGDLLMYLAAMTRREKVVVATEMSNLGLRDGLREAGIDLIRTNVGDRHVLQKLAELRRQQKGPGRPSVGGEQSGHMVYYDRLPTGDGILAAVQTALQLRQHGGTFDTWSGRVPWVEQALVSVDVTCRTVLNHPTILNEINRIRGVLGDNGELSARPSGTEPKARFMAQGPGAREHVEHLAAMVRTVAGTPDHA